MKSVGIITYHHDCNYGTMLQAYALQKKTEEMGYCSELINFVRDTSVSRIEILRLRFCRLPVYLREFKKYRIQAQSSQLMMKRKEIFEAFYRENMCVGTDFFSSTDELLKNPPQYDGYVVGSDQTWNPYVGGNPDAFYLTFVGQKERCGSYAPSIAVNDLSQEQMNRVRTLLGHIRFLSCRESYGAKLLETITGREVETVLDPTLLFDRQDWKRIERPIDLKSPFILQYFLGESREYREYVKQVQKRTGWRVVNISTTYLDFKDETPLICSPQEFLWLISHAGLVCTDSFHGTCFSVNFNTPFVSFDRYVQRNKKHENMRLWDFLERLKLKNRLYSIENAVHSEKMDFGYVNDRLEELRVHSTCYLEKMLKSITEGRTG